jgi:4-alpha-glucanotransferase
MRRASGILLHISSLSSPWGIGTMGEEAFRFVDFLQAAGLRYWQMLPVGPVGPGNSPYQSPGAFAGNELLIDLDRLASDGLLSRDAIRAFGWGDRPEQTDYGAVRAARRILLGRAFEAAPAHLLRQVEDFGRRQGWMEDYCLYCAIRDERDGAPLWEWPAPLALRAPEALAEAKKRLAHGMAFHAFLQYLFFSQFFDLRRYAAERSVGLIGDMPIYVSPDGADVWANRALFELGEDARPLFVAGVGPDAFSPDGQRWGNPLYDWKAVGADGWRWWIERMRWALSMFDLVRIDHFRGLDSYWAIPAQAPTAREGVWRDGPGMEWVRALTGALGPLPVIAEDLGMLTPRVRALLAQTGFPGMKVLQFAFEPGMDSEYLPHRHVQNAVCYTGTHDNDTLRGWLDALDGAAAETCRGYLGVEKGGEAAGLLRAAFASVCDLTIVPMQDLLGLGSQARMNRPGSVGDHNWSWRMTPGAISDHLINTIRNLNKIYYRL